MTQISQFGEFKLIDHLTQNINPQNASTIKGIGDDAAVLDYNGKQTVVTTDLLVEGVHFNLMYAPLKHLGYKSVIVNLSDVYAMNAHPKQITVSIAVSNRFPVEALDELYSGIRLACNNYHVDLVGGDTTSSVSGVTICITAIGEVDKDNFVCRSTAKTDELILVTGDLGAAYMGLQLLEREKELFKDNPNLQPELQGYEYILERQLKPEARRDIIRLFEQLNIKPTSMIDISDGLSSELLHICHDSGIGCRIFPEKIPVAPETAKMARQMNIEPEIAALNGGEDYELLFTLPSGVYEKTKIALKKQGISVIGNTTEKEQGMNLIPEKGEPVPLKAQGWDMSMFEKQ